MSAPPSPRPGKRLSLSPEAKARRERSAQAAAKGKKGFAGQKSASAKPKTAVKAASHTQKPTANSAIAPNRAPTKVAAPPKPQAKPEVKPAMRPTTLRAGAGPRRASPLAPSAPSAPTLQVPAPGQPRNQAEGIPEGIRLNKRMADLGLCSRREADDWIAKGWVLVNNAVAEMGQRVRVQDAIRIDPKARARKQQQATFLLHKPIGYVSGQAEDGHEPASVLITAANHWRGDPSPLRFHPAQLRGLAPAGRLDIDSTGLLVLTQDGLIARSIIGQDSDIEKEYLVRVEYLAPAGVIAHNVQAAFPAAELGRLRHGLSLDGKALLPAKVEWQNPEQLRFVLKEGKKRQIRRMCELVGLQVVSLKRIRIGRVKLGALPPGQWRYLAPGEQF